MSKQRWKKSVQGEIPGHALARIKRLGHLARTPADQILIEEASKSLKSTLALEQCRPGQIHDQLVAIQAQTTDQGQRLRIGWAIRRAQSRLIEIASQTARAA